MMFRNKKDRLLANCLDQIVTGQLTIETCEDKYPHIKQELKVAISLMQDAISENHQPTSSIRQRTLKSKILTNLPDKELPVTNLTKPRYNLQNQKRRFAMSWIIIVSTIVALASGGGLVFASNDALPGEILYPVKIWVEDVRLAAAADQSDVGLQFNFSEKRIEEIEALIELGELEEIDEAILGYGNQSQLMGQTMAKIKAEDPEEAIRLRTELETKLQEQARRMEDLLDQTEETDEFVRDRVRLMLQSNTQLRERMHQEDEIPEESELVVDTEDTKVEDSDEIDESETEVENNKGNGQISAQVDNETASFKFSLGGQGQNGVYAMISGTRFECSVDGDMAVCPAENAPNKGALNLYDSKTNQLLFAFEFEHSFAFEHNWQGEKNENGENGNQGSEDGGTSKENNNQNNNGK